MLNAEKEIFVRDIYKSWYVTGINSSINSVDKLVDFLKEITFGYKVILIGSSAGGYLAALLGSLMKAEYVIAFSAQFELRNQWAEAVNPFLKKYDSDYTKSKYYDLSKTLIESDTPVYYIVPIKSVQDRYHYNHVKNIRCMRPIVFNSSHHGIVMLKGNLNHFLSLSQEELQRLYDTNKGKIITTLEFSRQIDGMTGTIAAVVGQVKIYFKSIIKKMKK